MNLEILNPLDSFQARVKIGDIKAEINRKHTVADHHEGGIRFTFSLNSQSIRMYYRLEIRNRQEVEAGHIYRRLTGTHVDDCQEDEFDWHGDYFNIIHEIFLITRSHLKGKHFTFVTDKQYYELQFFVFDHLIKHLGFEEKHLNSLSSDTSFPYITSDDSKSHDIKMVLAACVRRNALPDWVRAGIGYSNDPRPDSISIHKGKRNG